MDNINVIRSLMKEAALEKSNVTFFKTGAGGYAEHDKFINVPVPVLRKIALKYKFLEFTEIKELLHSKINEERSLALFILVHQYKKDPDTVYRFYLDNLKSVNNWNLVDNSAHLIMGAYLLDKDKTILLEFARSEILWERRIAIVATWWFIRKGELEWTYKIAEILLEDKHDLIHKATGWMLREAGKRDVLSLECFLEEHAGKMPRTMLRYAIEKFAEDKRIMYMSDKALR